ncbi:UDP-2,4-diacetamido-2,4,6-trideoxy-beta-L-altropyranose hydrolase [Govanella unica]|uniref:UDP-2,4-diacetamido-2,4, 6-trideoxy-beta-L-altropyranose hydrolase n=1 Tax=Govanella unica TaxID=2975056 RepID=A0A9X3TZU2_9PROT|nr:UDP-2,4-diacetamido-2,4,6-trideoxy-beta-L-altropyranose hydrolase [Govania unica]MDA5194712.1 UDP-2,4-diacetamido-2,4,6-trideoxy-beta-L-altropyranose hydrolase [Govania unica]
MKVAIRADAGLHMGAGHLMRCLTLAEALRAEGATVRFFCREHKGQRHDLLRGRGFDVVSVGAGVDELPQGGDELLPPHANWLGGSWTEDVAALESGNDLLIVDHYALDAKFERAMREKVRRVMVIDDLCDRDHDADLLLDQGLGRTAAAYRGRVAVDCSVLVGTHYALLRPEFLAARQTALERRMSVTGIEHLLVTMGGMDMGNLTGRVLAGLDGASLRKLTVVMGSTAPHLEKVRETVAGFACATEFLVDCEEMAEVMTEADAAIGAVGATSWERCCLGLPTLGIVAADNQREAAENLAAAGAIVGPVDAREMTAALAGFLAMPQGRYQALSTAAANVCDGAGVERVMTEIRELFR